MRRYILASAALMSLVLGSYREVHAGIVVGTGEGGSGGSGGSGSADLCVNASGTAKICCDRYPGIGFNDSAMKCCIDSGGISEVCPTPPVVVPSTPHGVPPIVVDPQMPNAPLTPIPTPVAGGDAQPFPPPILPAGACMRQSDCSSFDTDPNDCQVAQCVFSNNGVNNRNGQCELVAVDGCVPIPQGECVVDADCPDADTSDCSVPQCERILGATISHCVSKPKSDCVVPSDPVPGVSGDEKKLACTVSCLTEDCHIAVDDKGQGVGWKIDYTAPVSLGVIASAELTQLSGPELLVEGTASSGAMLTAEKVLTRKTITDPSNLPAFIAYTPKPKTIIGEFLPKFSVKVTLRNVAGLTLAATECKSQTAIEVNGGGCSLLPSSSGEVTKKPFVATLSTLLVLGIFGVFRMAPARVRKSKA